MSNVAINITSQFLGQKAFDKAGQATTKLANTVKHALIGVGVEEFARRSVMAFAENEKQMAALSRTMSNLGLEMQNASVGSYLDKLSLATGVLKHDLVPAFQTLLNTTKNVGDSQKLLSLAMDLSAGGAGDLGSVVNALQKGYLNNFGALGKLRTGMSKATLETKDFQQMVDYLSATFSGQSKAASNTFIKSLDRIKIAVGNAQEAIGGGIIDSLKILTGSTSIDQLQKKIIDFGTNAGNALRTFAGIIKENETALKNLAALMAGLFIGSKITAGIYVVIGAFEALSKTMKILRNTAIGAYIAEMAVLNPVAGLAAAAGIAATIYGVIKSLDMLSGKFDEVKAKSTDIFGTTATGHLADLQKNFGGTTKPKPTTQLSAYEKAQLKLAEEQKKAAADALKLAKAKAIFDLKNIQIQAALKGNLTDEERARLLLMKAIEDENITLIEKYTKLLTEAQTKAKELQTTLDGIKGTTFGDPFTSWKGSIQSAIDELKNLKGEALYIAQLATPISGQYDPRVLTAGQRINSAGEYVSYNPDMAAAGMTANPYRVPVAPTPTPSVNETKVEVNFNGIVTDPVGTANQIKQVLESSANQVGNVYSLGTGFKDVQYIV